ncbi:MAG: hypothetical protein H6700_07825 [Myxococcales bacterium]|nr:hypothetical protein [Myxococcales bacterium]MCB9521014.1 hypothetical protein [Myxococcales bacterium]MCB9531659.1 hypothetical protein [Myxococcales bacterium]
MPDEPDSRNRGAFSESGAFELTDLGACSFLDSPSAVSPSSITPRSLSENVDAVCNSGLPTQRASCPPDGKTGCDDSPSRRPARLARAAAHRRGHDRPRAGVSTSQSSPTATADATDVVPDDRLDAALADFLGSSRPPRGTRSELEAIYGAVFDPEARAAELARDPRTQLSGSQRAVSSTSPRFGWDDEELDRPLDPDELRRRVGRRTDGIPQSAIFRRRRPRPEASSSDSELP